MEGLNKKIKDFTDLDAWQEAHKLVLSIYKITNSFPEDEKYGLISQMKRSAVSVTSNIAEGFGRSTKKDKIRFYTIAIGSLYELRNQLITSKDLGFLPKSIYSNIENQIIKVQKIVNGLIRYLNL